MRKIRLRLRRFSENVVVGRFRSREKSLFGFDCEGVRQLRPGDSPISSSFDLLRSVLRRRYFLRVKRADRAARMLIALDNTPSMAVALGGATPRSVEFAIAEELVEGFAGDGGNEIGFVLWSREIEEYVVPISGVQRIRERLAELSRCPAVSVPTRPEKLFEYALNLQRNPAIIFAFSDWRDAGDFTLSLKRCLAADIDIVPVVIFTNRKDSMPRFLGDALFKSAETGRCKGFSGMTTDLAALEIFRSCALPVIEIDASAPETAWEDSFDEYFDFREKERR